jgi:hypothetical protein
MDITQLLQVCFVLKSRNAAIKLTPEQFSLHLEQMREILTFHLDNSYAFDSDYVELETMCIFMFYDDARDFQLYFTIEAIRTNELCVSFRTAQNKYHDDQPITLHNVYELDYVKAFNTHITH